MTPPPIAYGILVGASAFVLWIALLSAFIMHGANPAMAFMLFPAGVTCVILGFVATDIAGDRQADAKRRAERKPAAKLLYGDPDQPCPTCGHELYQPAGELFDIYVCRRGHRWLSE